MKFTIDEFRAWKNRSITLLGMSGVGKTHLSMLLRNHFWFHYSGDYRIGTRYLDEPIMDLIKQQAMQTPFLRDLLRRDWIRIRNNIKVDDLGPVLSFVGKLGNPELGGVPLEEFSRRQALYRQADQQAQWIAEQKRLMRKRNSGRALTAELRRCLKRPLTQKRREDVEAVLGYVERNTTRMSYADFRSRGWPRGSAAIESVNHGVIQARFKLPGMRWTVIGVNRLLRLRNAYFSGTWDEVFTNAMQELIHAPPDPAKAVAAADIAEAQEIRLEPGVAVFIPPGLHHQMRADGKDTLRLVTLFSPPVTPGTYDPDDD